MTTFFLIMTAINMMKNFNSLRFFSLGVMFAIILSILIVIFQSPQFFEYNKNQEEYEIEYFAKELNLKMITGFTTMIMSYSCHPIFFYLRGELKSKTIKRGHKVIRNTIIIEIIIYSIIAVISYFTFGKNLLPEVITLRKPLPDSNDILMTIIKYSFIPVTLMHIPINLFAVRD